MYAGPRYEKDRWRASVQNGRIEPDRLGEVERWPTFDPDLDGPAMAHREAAAAMGVLLRQAAEDGFGDLTIAYSYRTLAVQEHKWDLWQAGTGNLAAVPGTSNHGWGVSFDMRWGRGSTLTWLQTHARRYGFVADVESENWHYTLQEGLWEGDDLTSEEKQLLKWLKGFREAMTGDLGGMQLLNWLDGFREAVTGTLSGMDSGQSIGKRVADAVEHAGSRHAGGVDASMFSTPRHRHPEEKTGGQIETRDGGHVHGERVTGEAVEPDEIFGG